MKTHTKILGGLVITLGMFAVAGAVSATPADTLQPASIITYNEEVVVNNTLRANSAYIGSTEAGVGGVTFFNGSIVNNSVDDDGESTIPVTVADNVRIDGRIYRGETSGSGDDMPMIVLDDMEVSGDLTVTGELTGYYTGTEVDALVGLGGHDHIGDVWSGSVQGSLTSSVLTLANTGNGSGLIAASSGNFVGIAGGASGTSAAIYGLNTGSGPGSGPGVSGIGTAGYGVFAQSTSGISLYVDGKVGVNAAANKAAGTGTISAGGTSAQIDNTSVTADSIILLTIGHAGATGPALQAAEFLRISTVTAGASFVVATADGDPASDNIPFGYLIIN